MTISFWQQADLGAEIECDLAIIGGGIVGVSTAYWIKKAAPRLRTVIIESRTTASGASGRNAGFLLQGTDANYATDVTRFGPEKARLLWSFTEENRQLIGSECSPERIDLNPSGSLLAAGSAEEATLLQKSAEHLRQEQIPVTSWSAQEVKERLGGVFHGALYIDSGASINPVKLVRELAGTSGALLLEHHPVHAIDPQGDKTVIYTRRRRILAERVCLTLNAYLPRLLPSTHHLIRPVRAQMLSTGPVTHWLPLPLYSHYGYYYIRQSLDGSVLVGGARHLFEKTEIGYDDRTTAPLQNALLSYFATHFPDKQTLSPTSRWSGTMAFTPDGLPIVSPLENAPDSLWAAGFNGHGMGYGFRFGRLLANLLTGAHDESAYHSVFTVDRFGVKAPLS